MVTPGEQVNIITELLKPVAIEQGMLFAIREGGITVGHGLISKIIK